MAVPTRKSKTSIEKRRHSEELKFFTRAFNKHQIKCSNCKKKKLLHHICPYCFSYRSKITL